MTDPQRVERTAERLYTMAADYGWTNENRNDWDTQPEQYKNRWRTDAQVLLDESDE